jgi:hypothetical protein
MRYCKRIGKGEYLESACTQNCMSQTYFFMKKKIISNEIKIERRKDKERERA